MDGNQQPIAKESQFYIVSEIANILQTKKKVLVKRFLSSVRNYIWKGEMEENTKIGFIHLFVRSLKAL